MTSSSSSGNAKWRQTPSLVMLLPHGYEGQGPEHSSARLERYLELAAGDNIRIVNCTTSAQYFHVLRRQAALLQSAPRPLIIMTPKGLLNHPKAASSLDDLTHGTFQPVLDDPKAREHADQVRRLVLCSGKVYVDFLTSKYYNAEDPRLAVARIEELYPFPAAELEQRHRRLPQSARGGLDAGGAAQHGRVGLHPLADHGPDRAWTCPCCTRAGPRRPVPPKGRRAATPSSRAG